MNQLYLRFNREEYHASDPVEFLHRYGNPLDQEVVGLYAALMAYGGVGQIKASVRSILGMMEKSAATPSEWILKLRDPKFAAAQRRALRGFRHRLYVGADIVRIGELLCRSRENHGFLGAHFGTYLQDGADLAGALDGVMADWKAWAAEPGGAGKRGPYFSHLLSSPSGGSACKRWCMFLRWMIREDQVDIGIWGTGGVFAAHDGFRGIPASALFMPLDTHSGRISRYLGLTDRKTLGWRAVTEVTEALKNFDPADPVKYDFALSRLGILDLCQHEFREEICLKCDLVSMCRYGRGRSAEAGA